MPSIPRPILYECSPTLPHRSPSCKSAGLVGPSAPEMAPKLGTQDGVLALVLKPAVLGGFERTLQLASWARRQGMQVHMGHQQPGMVGVGMKDGGA